MFRKLLTTLLLVVSAIAITACGGDSKKDAPHVPVQSISVKSTVMTLDPSYSSPIEVVFNPSNATNKALTYVSDNTSVLTVSENGTITTQAVTADSTATITITSADNSSATATVAVTVRAKALGYSIVNDVWEIYNADGLVQFNNIANKSTNVKLTADIDLTGKSWVPFGEYAGIFDGNGKTITGLNINNPMGSDQGLFSVVDATGVVKNLGLIDPTVKGDKDVGAIAGYNIGTIISSYVIGGTIEAITGSVGGIAGGGSNHIAASYVKGTQLIGAPAGAIVGTNSGTLNTNFYQAVTGATHGIAEDIDGNPSDTNADTTNDITTNVAALNNALALHSHEYVVSGDKLIIQQKATVPALPSIDSYGYYLVDSAQSLNLMRDYINLGNLNVSIRLAQDIDLSSSANWIPINNYTGTFDGNGKTISNLTIDESKVGAYAMFTSIGLGGVVENLGLVNPYIKGVGLVSGIAIYNSGTMIANYVTGGTLKGSLSTSGITLLNKGSIIANYVSGSIIEGDAAIVLNNSGVLKSNFYNVEGVINGPSDISSQQTSDIRTNIDDLNNALAAHSHEYVVSGDILAVQKNANSPMPNKVDGFYQVRTADELLAMNKYIAEVSTVAKIKLMADIDLENKAWTQIQLFQGTFDGNGHAISNLNKGSSETTLRGLIASNEGTVKNLGLVEPVIETNDNASGIADVNYGTISASYIRGGSIKGAGENIGGIAGKNLESGAKISASYVSGSRIISNSTATTNVGGIVGNSYEASTVVNCYVKDNATIEATGTGNIYLGGIAGSNTYDSSIIKSNVSGNTIIKSSSSASASADVGGIAGSNQSIIKESSVTGSATIEGISAGDVHVGGIAGYNNGTIATSYVSGNDVKIKSKQTGSGNAFIGGIAGVSNAGTVTKNYVEGATVSSVGTARTHVGGIVGDAYSGGTITANYVSGGSITGTGTGEVYVGGIVGDGKNSITENFVTSNTAIKGSSSDVVYVGGIAGGVGNSSILSANYTKDINVTGEHTAGGGRDYVGGIAGFNSGRIIANYVSGGSVKGLDSVPNVGGVVGYNQTDGTITAVYSTAIVTSAYAGLRYVNGVVSHNEGAVNTAYFLSSKVDGGDIGIGNDSGTASNVEGVDTIEALNGKVPEMNSKLGSNREYEYKPGTDQTKDLPTVVKVVNP